MSSSADRPNPFYRVVRRLMLGYFRLYHRIEFRGLEHIPSSGPFILVANHASFLDPPAIGCALRGRTIHYMARDTLMKLRPVKVAMRWMGVIPIDRNRGDVGALKSALKLLKEGGSLGLFPEGTRTLDGNLQSPKAGIGFLVVKAGVPVVPAYIDGSFQAYSKKHRWIRPYKIVVSYGPPIEPAELGQTIGDKSAYETTAELIMERIASAKTPKIASR
ncbi:MAG: 1-acyl-sn-glycerol-3-phosphate acyltransferase [Verrucomicrobia bacterium]|nr:1-acyl-sn-glycerol-3-phosphate acyltransferase [Verrucomicrobiota bacterium]